MISKTIGYNGVHYFQTHPHGYGKELIERWFTYWTWWFYIVMSVYWMVSRIWRSYLIVYWLVVSNMNFIFHFIYGIILSIDELIFFKMAKTTNQSWFDIFPIQQPCLRGLFIQGWHEKHPHCFFPGLNCTNLVEPCWTICWTNQLNFHPLLNQNNQIVY